ncbi:MAG: hypothetical protein LM593_06430 [Candidatus Verstraetearchaeota archaeon]|jgi:hypothetical protein|nr:hypothetical protein [Candidatus Verstraetearchaeota archaeon]
MYEFNGNYKGFIQDFFRKFIVNDLEKLINIIINKDSSKISYKDIEKDLNNIKDGITSNIKDEFDKIAYEDKFLKKLFEDIISVYSSILEDFCEKLQDLSYSIYYELGSYYKKAISGIKEIIEYEYYDKLDKIAEKVIKSINNDIEDFSKRMKKDLSEAIRETKKFQESIYDRLNKELLYHISTFILFYDIKEGLIKELKGKKYKILKLKGCWIDEEKEISLHQCLYEILNKVNISVKDRNLRKVLLNILKNDELLENIFSESNIIEYYEKSKKNPEEGKKFLLGILCKYLKCENKEILLKILDIYFLPIFLIAEYYLKLPTNKKQYLFKQIFVNRKSILDLEIFGNLSKLNIPSAINIEIYELINEESEKIEEKSFGEIDVVALYKDNIYLIEITTEKNINEKINELKKKIEVIGSLLSLDCRGIIIHSEDQISEKRDEIFLIPFVMYDEELQKIIK